MPPAVGRTAHATPAALAAIDVIVPPACSALTSVVAAPPAAGADRIALPSTHTIVPPADVTGCGAVMSCGSVWSSATTLDRPAPDTVAT